ncbi:MAG: hypothetical protein ACJ786_24475 [Catenulispora sp.]
MAFLNCEWHACHQPWRCDFTVRVTHRGELTLAAHYAMMTPIGLDTVRDRTMRVMEPFRIWLEGRGLGRLAEPAGAVLTARRDYAGRTDPTYWRGGDVHDLMTWVVPARMTDSARIAELGVAGLGAFLDFLDETGRLHPGSLHVKALNKELARVGGGFGAAMADRSRWRMAKVLYETMRVEGVDIADEDAVQDWFSGFNQAAPERRRAVLGQLLDKEPAGLLEAHFVARDGSVAALRRSDFERRGAEAIPARFRAIEPETFRPVRLAPESQLADEARRSPVLRQAAALVAWVGQGRPADKKGRLAGKASAEAAAFVAERSALSFSELLLTTEVLPLAVAMEWVDLRRTGFVVGRRSGELAALTDGAAADVAVLRIWREALDILIRPEAPDHVSADAAQVAELMEQAEPVAAWVLTELYRSAGPVPFDDLLDEAIAGSALDGVTEHPLLGLLVMTLVRTRLHSAWRHGALDAQWSEVPDGGAIVAERAPGQGLQPWYALDIPDLAFGLTPLGMWGVRDVLAAEGDEVPVSR